MKTLAIKDYLKKKSHLKWELLVLIIAFISILAVYFKVDYTSDDFKYRFFFDTMGTPHPDTKPISGILAVFASMKNHWQLCNGRVVAHGILQSILPFGKIFFKVFSSAVYTFLGYLIYRHASYGKKSDPSLLAFIFILMWLFLPQFNLSVLWASGASNYLWMAALILAFLLPYRMYAVNSDSVKDSAKNAILMGIFGLFAGCTNENNGGAVVIMTIMYIIVYLIKGTKIPKWSWIGTITSVCGMIVLLTAPGNYRINSKTDLAGYIARFKDIYAITKELTIVLMIILLILLIINLIDKSTHTKSRKERLVPITYFISSIAMIVVLVASAMHPQRTWFASIAFLILVIGWFWSEIRFESIKPLAVNIAKWVIVIAFGVVFINSYTTNYSKLSSTYAQIEEGLDIIKDAQKNGVKDVTIPFVTPSDSDYDPYRDTYYAVEDTNSWMNQWIAEYYGLNSITAKK